jgi:ribonuclease R
MNIEEKIFQFFSKYPNEVFKVTEIARRLGLSNHSEIILLKQTLKNMVNGKKITQSSRKKYGHNQPTHSHFMGTFKKLKNGNGIFTPFDQDSKQIFIPSQFTETALDDDIVSVNVFPFPRNKKNQADAPGNAPEGEIVEIVKRSKKKYTGKFEKTRNFFIVIPDDRNLGRGVYIPKGKTLGAKPGTKVAFVIDEWKSKDQNPEGTILEKLGKVGDVSAELLSVIHLFNLPLEFPKQVLQEAEKIQDEIPEADLKHRLDFRDEVCFTIDPEDAKDFDDAVSLKKIEGDLYELGIHIADVSHYVKSNSIIDAEAFNRGTSVYLANEVVPMLPENLSNNICSLIAKKDRMTYSVMIQITNKGEVKKYEISKSIINSNRRFSYEEVQQILDKGKGDYHSVLKEMYTLSQVLNKNRIKNGSIDFETSEVKFRYDHNGKPTDIVKKVRLGAHRLVEEFMLLANRLVAEQIGREKKNKKPFIYRIHDKPDKEKLVELGKFVSQFGYLLSNEAGTSSKSLQKLLNDVKGKEEEEIINQVAIRSMAKAIYSDGNIGHFGLGFKHYTHFTSPIRRYPDLIVHRLLDEYINKKGKTKDDTAKDIKRICEQSSIKERNAIDAERQSVKVMQIEYMKRHVGEVFRAVISGVMRYGLFVEIVDYLVEGLVRVRDLEDDYYIYDEKNYAFTGRHTKKRYRLGDKIKVQVIRVDSKDQEIDFMIVDKPAKQ